MKTSLEHLEKLIAFPSVSRDSNLDLIAYVRDFLSGLRIDCETALPLATL